MYVPQHFEMSKTPVLHDFIQRNPLGSWVIWGREGLDANHIPFLIDRNRGEFGTLMGHVARANPVWKESSAGTRSMVIFCGPQGYISPNWYPSKRDKGMVVPTWNYCVVHAHGTPRVIEKKTWLRDHVAQLVDVHESSQAVPWKVDDAPSEFIDKMLNAIVGIEIPISRLVGKWKVSQNRSEVDRQGVVAGLRAKGDEVSASMAGLVEESR